MDAETKASNKNGKFHWKELHSQGGQINNIHRIYGNHPTQEIIQHGKDKHEKNNSNFRYSERQH